jgi:hypothetical protein
MTFDNVLFIILLLIALYSVHSKNGDMRMVAFILIAALLLLFIL